jgi:hypothetical protein
MKKTTPWHSDVLNRSLDSMSFAASRASFAVIWSQSRSRTCRHTMTCRAGFVPDGCALVDHDWFLVVLALGTLTGAREARETRLARPTWYYCVWIDLR